MPLYDSQSLRALAERSEREDMKQWLKLRAEGLDVSPRKPLNRTQAKELAEELAMLASQLRKTPATVGEVWGLVRTLEMTVDDLLWKVLEPQQSPTATKKRQSWGIESTQAQEPPPFRPV